MKKKLIATLLTAAMTASLLAGCGGSAGSAAPAEPAPAAEEAAPAAEEAAPAAEEEAPAEEAAPTEEAAPAEEATANAGDNDKLAGTQFEGTTAKEPYNFAIDVKSFQSTYWQAALKGMDMAKEELGITYDAHGPNSESDIADQVNMLNSDINSNPPGIALAACDTKSVLDSLKTCADKKIPVVCFDTGVADAPEGSVVATVATDNTQAGEVAAENMYTALKDVIAKADGQVRVGEVNQDATALNIQQRGMGFVNKFTDLVTADGKTVAVVGNEFYANEAKKAHADLADEKSADVVIEVAVPAQTTVELCSTAAQAIMSKSDTIGIFGSNQTAAEGVLAADANLSVLGTDAAAGDVIGIGFDAGSIIKGAISDGTMYGAVTQSPLMMGYYAIYALTMAANGDKVEDFPTAGYWYDANNMNDDTIAPNLYD
ncbi:MAG: substrate-binding domain-containing protein [Lachnospiraceae bacterium]|nr:substrate-binding domain-containing protein [Lachnospiraceae bacterium]